MKLSAVQHNLVHELYLRTADETYIVARWCASVGLGGDFLWNSTHALEKYLKAVLLLNGRSIRDFNHDLVEMYDELTGFAGEFMPAVLTRPTMLNIGSWYDEAPRAFLERLERVGSANNRYLLFGFDYRADDLHKLDTLAFAIRRLAWTLDDEVRGTSMTFRQALASNPVLDFSVGMPLDLLIRSREMTPERRTTLNLNFAFAPKDFPHEAATGRSASHHPVIWRRVFEPLESDTLATAFDGMLAAQWLLDNVSLPGPVQSRREIKAAKAAVKKGEAPKLADPGLRDAIETAMNDAKAKHGFVWDGATRTWQLAATCAGPDKKPF